MKKITFRDYVELIKISNGGYSIEQIPLNDTLSINDKHLINFNYLLLFCILGKRSQEEIINSKKLWISYLHKHDDCIVARKKYYNYALECLYKLLNFGFYNMHIYYKTFVTNEILPFYLNWLNSYTLLPIHANKIKKWWIKYK
jgi:hypothetical protein